MQRPLRVPFSRNFRVYSRLDTRGGGGGLLVSTRTRGVKKREGKMGKHLRTVDRVGALKARAGRVTGRCFRLIAGSTVG